MAEEQLFPPASFPFATDLSQGPYSASSRSRSLFAIPPLPEIPLIRLKTRLSLFSHLFREDLPTATAFTEFHFVERGRLQNDQELVLGTPAIGLFSVSRSTTAASRFFLPFRQGHIRNSALLCQSHDEDVLRRHHLLDDGLLVFRTVSFHLHRTSRTPSQYTLIQSVYAISVVTSRRSSCSLKC